MGLTILFGDRKGTSSVHEIAHHAREVVDEVLRRNGRGDVATCGARPVWHSVAMQIELEEASQYAPLLAAIRSDCAHRRVDVMGVRVA
jgi:hypothetical protein